MTIADDIVTLIQRKRKLELTAEDISEMLFGQTAYPQRVTKALQQLIDEKRLVRRGSGGAANPYTYHLPPIRRRI